MDALSCTPAVRSSPIPVASLKGRYNNATASVQVCASRNGNVNGGSVAETSSLSTLPLPSSRLFFPSPLRSLWFDKGKQESTGEKMGAEEANICLLNESLDVSLRESFGSTTENGETEHGIQSDRMEISDGQVCEQYARGDPKQMAAESSNNDAQDCWEEFVLGESSGEGKTDAGDGKTQEESCPASNAEGKEGKSHVNASLRRNRGNWIARILELRSFWKHQKKYNEVSDSDAVMEPCCSQNRKGSASENLHYCDHGDCDCAFCSEDHNPLSSSALEVPRTEANHDRDSFSRFLHHVSLMEAKLYTQMSYLCNLAYSIPDIKPGDLLKNHHLRLITSSLDKKAEAASKASDSITVDKSSSTCTSSRKNEDSHRSEDRSKRRLPVNPAVAYEIAAAAASYLHSQTKYILPFKSVHGSKTDNDEKRDGGTKQVRIRDQDDQLMSSEAAKDAEVAMVDPKSACNPEAEQKFTILAQVEEPNELSSLSKSEVASYIATTSVTAVVAAKEETKQAVAKDLQSIHSSPCEWFICDDESSHTRYFVIQGSESLASWQANLLFEPIQFEGLEVLVHRGIYEAAKGIYEQILPEVHAHLKTCGEAARLRFTGHSLGGSLSVLLNLMLLIRGVVPSLSLLPVITFGSPCIMCGGDYLLQKLGLSSSHIQSIIMHRDIVPRAFACNYPEHVAEILRRLNANFRNHPCLKNQGLLYAPMGQLLILQPDEKISPSHHLLPCGSGLYLLRYCMHIESECEPLRAVQVRAAQIAFLNSPHPLEMLSDPSAYGLKGAICRDHDSRNYLRTISHVVRQESKRLRRLKREQRRQMWWPLITAESSMLIQRSSKVGVSMDSKTFAGAVCVKSSPGQAPRRFEFPLRAAFIFQSSKDKLRRFARLIASQHMQMGILFVLSARMLIVKSCAVFYM
eukprot:Gb_40072 [translate_table: standard]